jgi:hypothetical protein
MSGSGGYAPPMADDAGVPAVRASDAELDLREARVVTSEVRIDAGTIFGDVDLPVPEGVEVEVRSQTLFGDVEQEAGQAAPPAAPRIVLTSGTLCRDVRLRAKRLRERLVQRLAEPRRAPA